MTANVHGMIADWLQKRGFDDNDGFAKQAATAISLLAQRDIEGVRETLENVKSELFRRNRTNRKIAVCQELAEHLISRLNSTTGQAEARPALCKIVFFASNPRSTKRLELDEEAHAITEKIRAARYRDTVSLITAWATRPDDLLQYLNEHDATVVHFSGHGSGTTGLVMQNNSGDFVLVQGNALRALFKTHARNVRLVVLNACDSMSQARAIAKEIDCVIGMKASIGDEAARVFAASLYRAIAFGRSLQDAFEQGKAALLLEGIREEDTPELLVRKGAAASSITLV